MPITTTFLHNSIYRKCKPLKALDRAFMYLQKAVGFDRLKGQNLTISTGWTWFPITHRHCRHLVEHRPFIERVFRHTVALDELFMGTMVVNFGLEDHVYDIIWTNEPVMGVVIRLAARKLRKQGMKVVYMCRGFHFLRVPVN